MTRSQVNHASTNIRAGAALLLASLAWGCGADEGRKEVEDAGTPTVGPDAAGPNPNTPDAGGMQNPPTTSADAGGKLDASKPVVTKPDASVPGTGADAAAQMLPEDVDPMGPPKAGNDAPVLTKVGYYNDDLGLRVMLQGRDPNGDIASYTIRLFDKKGDPVSTDMDGEEGPLPSSNEFTNVVAATADEARFTFRFDPSTELLDLMVDSIKVVVTDAGGRVSTELTAKLGPAPSASSGCDPQGFNRCSGNNVCAFSGTRYSCSPVKSARMNACQTGPVLSPPSVASVRGFVRPSLWDAPTSCVSDDPKLRPDAVVTLRLAAPAAKVVLSTDNAYTTLRDTSLYLLQSCTADAAPCVDTSCTCADDVLTNDPAAPRRLKAVLTLTNLPAGDHLIVVDSGLRNTLGGDFELTATVE